ncbi:MAG: VWA domain-containing protein [Acidobacteria bacterium]|nr:VWA domain-containing protein [Acidobacteriota bacterium]MCB9398487.1 VWA domain-containing protein [Acidobacteriota bacterium]
MRHWLGLVLVGLAFWGCKSRPMPELVIVSGSENQQLEPLLAEIGRDLGVSVRMNYQGSVDIMLGLEQGTLSEFDAVWPAQSIWIEMGDRRHQVSNVKSIMRSPVVFALKGSVVDRLGWRDRPVRVSDILAAAEQGQVRFAMTSATQSNSGAVAYLGMLHALAGSPQVLTAEHLQNADIQDPVRRLLKGVNRSSGSSGWLKDMMLQEYDRFDGMFNYEALVIETNQELVRRGQEPLIAIYPEDGLAVADHPLGFIDRGDAQKKQAFLQLQERLLNESSRAKIIQMGRRAGLGLNIDNPNTAVFNPSWGIDATRTISTVPLPAPETLRTALELYQVALRKPSLTVYVLDFSGSMAGEGENQLKKAMGMLLDPNQAKRYLLQPSNRDVHLIVPFSSRPLDVLSAEGNEEATLRQLLHQVESREAGGGTQIYSATLKALELLQEREREMGDYFPAIILMTDGLSDGSLADLQSQMNQFSFVRDVPLFSITFGEADLTQLKELNTLFPGRVFDGSKNLADAFRKAKGYN